MRVPTSGRIALVAGAAWIAGQALEVAGVPAAYLFGGLLLGLAVALVPRLGVELPAWLYGASQSLVGAAIGGVARAGLAGSVAVLAALPVVVAVTIALSLGAGAVLAKRGGLGSRTALLGMVAGGSTAVVAAADEMNADARHVAVMQYMRVALVALTAPLVASAVRAGAGRAPAGPAFGWQAHALSAAGLIAIALAGAWLGKRLRLPASALTGPLLLATLIGWTDGLPDAPFPSPLVNLALALIGLEIGLRFKPQTLRELGRMLPTIVGLTAGLSAACAAVGYTLSSLTNLSPIEGYLMTTPGGINAVLAVAVGTPGVNMALVTVAQIVRLLAMAAVMPVMIRALVRRDVGRRRSVPAHRRSAKPLADRRGGPQAASMAEER